MVEDRGDFTFRAPSLYGTADDITYAGALSFLRRRYTRDLAGVDVVVSGIPYDLGTSNRPGSRFGPRAIRQASTHIAWGPQWPYDFDPLHRLAVIDWGDHAFDIGYPERMTTSVETSTLGFFKAGCFPMTMGGDHFVTYPLLRAAAKHHGEGLSLIHFDAHTDTSRTDNLNHGSMFYHGTKEGLIDPARSIHMGIRMHVSYDDGFNVIDGWQMQQRSVDDIGAQIRDVVGDNKAYVTFDIDFLDPAYAPGTGTPVVGGPTTTVALDVLRHLQGLDLIGMDLVEVAPEYDVGECTSLAGASILYQMLHVLAQDRPVMIEPDGEGGG